MAEIVKSSTVGNPVFWVSFALCAGLIVAGFLVPPMGVVDGSVLTAVGELFAFPTLWTVWHAIERGIDARVRHGKTSLEVGSFDDGTRHDENGEEE